MFSDSCYSFRVFVMCIQIAAKITVLLMITLRMKSSFHDPMFDFHVPGEISLQGEFAGTVETLERFAV